MVPIPASGAPVSDRRLIHNVYFTLHDGTRDNVQRLISSCRELLLGHPGEVFFGVGPLVSELDRPVNVCDFHVGLLIVFASKLDHDAYQTAPRHEQFIERNKATWSQVRVFDTYGS